MIQRARPPVPQPNFFIVGAPKCGTTAMWRYLSDHPRVFMTRHKEPHYFASDLDDPVLRSPDVSFDWYRSLFEDAGDATVVGEASVLYLFSGVAPARIKETYPSAKVLVMLRNPVDLVYSFHNTLLYSGQEQERDFHLAWRLQDSRGGSPLLEYGEVGKLGKQVERLLSVFGREQVLMVLFEDFTADPAREYARVLSFLDLPADERASFPVVNPSRRHRSELVRELIERLPDPKPIKRLLGVRRLGLTDRIQRWNLGRRERPPLSPAFRAELTDYFAPDVKRLSELLDRDLSHWSASTGDEGD